MIKEPAEPVPIHTEQKSPFAEAANANDSTAQEADARHTGDGHARISVTEARAAERAERAAKVISLVSLLLLFVAVALYAALANFGWNPYIAAVALFCAGSAGYPLLTMLTHAVASQTSRVFKGLSPYDRFQWAQKMPSILHAVSMSLTGLNVVMMGHWACQKDILDCRNEMVAAFLALELAYLLQDTCMEVLKQVWFGRSFSLLRWVHHLVLLALLPLYYKHARGDLLLGLFFLCNAATVPRQLLWYFRMCGMKRHRILHLLTTFALGAIFIATHILSVFYVLHLHCRSQHISWHDIPYRIPANYLAAGGALVLCNTAWLVSLYKDLPPRRGSAKSA